MARTDTDTRRSVPARIGSGLVNLALVLATLAGLAYLAPTVMGYERYVITGGSMSGTFEKGSIAFEKPVDVQDLQVGDIITYQPPADSGVTHLVTHRIHKISTTDEGVRQYETKGDANPDPDPWKFQLTADTQPVVEHTVPLVGYVFVALADREIRMFAIGIPAALVALGAIVELVRGLRPEKKTEAQAGATGRHAAAHA